MRRSENGMPTASVARRLGTLNGENQMNDQQFEALLGAINELTDAIRRQSIGLEDNISEISAYLNEFCLMYGKKNNVSSDDVDMPIGGDGE